MSDAEMPNHKALSEDLQEIAEHLSNLRAGLDGLVGSIGATGSHQADALQGRALDALDAVEDAVRRAPWKSLAIAAGAGFLLGVLMRR